MTLIQKTVILLLGSNSDQWSTSVPYKRRVNLAFVFVQAKSMKIPLATKWHYPLIHHYIATITYSTTSTLH